MYDFILMLLLINSGFQNFIGPKLFSAADRGDIDLVDNALKKGADVHWKQPSGWNAGK